MWRWRRRTRDLFAGCSVDQHIEGLVRTLYERYHHRGLAVLKTNGFELFLRLGLLHELLMRRARVRVSELIEARVARQGCKGTASRFQAFAR